MPVWGEAWERPSLDEQKPTRPILRTADPWALPPQGSKHSVNPDMQGQPVQAAYTIIGQDQAADTAELHAGFQFPTVARGTGKTAGSRQCFRSAAALRWPCAWGTIGPPTFEVALARK